MSFSETIFLFFLALIIFGPKKLPEMARQAGKLLAELRRASNEFRSQIETEISHLESEKNRSGVSSAPPPGSVASMSLNPATSPAVAKLPEAPATLAAPLAPLASGDTPVMSSLPAPPGLSEAVPSNSSEAAIPAAQEPHA